ncbi:MAG TPA: type II toxin-antitoxin system VapC family toxin [Longimicrobiaceae bacterium]
MRLLLDTHVFLWWNEDDPRLKQEVKDTIVGAEGNVVSAASAWEVAIKSALGKLKLQVPFEEAVEINAFQKLTVDFRHASATAALPPYHADPFDRLLIAQALTEGLTLVTHDRVFARYGIPVIWT